MSGGRACSCAERSKPAAQRNWTVLALRSNHSAFNGYRLAESDYSEVRCATCGARWRTKAAYVADLFLDGAWET